jgi:hypothetical protein
LNSDFTIDELLKQVPEGEIRLFQRRTHNIVEDRFFAVHPNHEYIPRPEWHNRLPSEQAPWFGARQKERIPLTVLPSLDVTFKGPSRKIVDFYTGGLDVHFLSNRLVALIEELDPGALEYLPMTIKTKDGIVDYNVAMPVRNLQAVDPNRTNILVKDQNHGEQWFRYIEFPDGVVFRDEVVAGIHSFTDIDVHDWFWSRELIEAAKAMGVRGLYTVQAGCITGPAVNRL